MIDTNNIIQDQNKTILVHVVMQISSYFKVKKKNILQFCQTYAKITNI